MLENLFEKYNKQVFLNYIKYRVKDQNAKLL